MKTKIWISLVALIVAISALCYAVYLLLQVKTDADIMLEDIETLQKFNNEETTQMAQRAQSQTQPFTEESGTGEGNSRP